MSGGGVPTKCCSYGGSQIPHCAKSCRPFELFANENHKLRMNQNEMQHLREVRLKIHRHNPLFFEMNDASAWRISMPVMDLLWTWSQRQLVLQQTEQKKTCSNRVQRSDRHGQHVTQGNRCCCCIIYDDVFVALLNNLLCWLWATGLVSTSPVTLSTAASLLQMNPGWMSPVWGCSVHVPFWALQSQILSNWSCVCNHDGYAWNAFIQEVNVLSSMQFHVAAWLCLLNFPPWTQQQLHEETKFSCSCSPSTNQSCQCNANLAEMFDKHGCVCSSLQCTWVSYLCKIASALLVKHQSGKLCFKHWLCCISSLVCRWFDGEELSFITVHDKFLASNKEHAVCGRFCRFCNTLICLQLAVHRVSSYGTHRVVTHSRRICFSAHGTSCATSPTLCSSKEACSEEQRTIVSRRWSACHNGYVFWPLHPEHDFQLYHDAAASL